MSSSRALLAALAAVLVALTLGTSSSGHAAAPAPARCSPGVGVDLLPADGAARPREQRARSWVVAQLRPRATLEREVRVCNGTGAPQRLEVYPNAATVRDGSFLPLGSPRADNPLSSWTTVTPSSLDLPPDTAAVVRVRIAVPAGAPVGEQYGVVFAEQPATGQGPVGVVNRVGVRLYVSVFEGEDRLRADLVVESLTAGRDGDSVPYVTASVRNTGRLALDPRGSLRLSDGPGGTTAGPFPVTLGTTLAPGQTVPVRVALPADLPVGPWLARLEVASGDLRRAAEARIAFPVERDRAEPPAPAREVPLAEDPDVVVPVAVGLLLLVLLCLLLVLLARRRSRRRPPPTLPA